MSFRLRHPLLWRLLPWLLVVAVVALFVHYDVDIGPSSLEQIFAPAWGKRSPSRPPRH